MRFLAFLLVFLIGAFVASFVRAEEAGAVLFDNHGQWPVPGSWPS